MTVAMLREHGVAVDDADANRWAVAPGPIAAPSTAPIEPDLSNAAPFLALAAVTGGAVTVRDWPRAHHPGRRRAARDPARAMGCDVRLTDDGLRVRGGDGCSGSTSTSTTSAS